MKHLRGRPTLSGCAEYCLRVVGLLWAVLGVAGAPSGRVWPVRRWFGLRGASRLGGVFTPRKSFHSKVHPSLTKKARFSSWALNPSPPRCRTILKLGMDRPPIFSKSFCRVSRSKLNGLERFGGARGERPADSRTSGLYGARQPCHTFSPATPLPTHCTPTPTPSTLRTAV